MGKLVKKLKLSCLCSSIEIDIISRINVRYKILHKSYTYLCCSLVIKINTISSTSLGKHFDMNCKASKSSLILINDLR